MLVNNVNHNWLVVHCNMTRWIMLQIMVVFYAFHIRELSTACLKVVCVLPQLPAKVEQTSSPCRTSKPAPTWPSLLSSTSRCASALTLRKFSAWDRVRSLAYSLLCRERLSGERWNLNTPSNETASLKRAPAAVRLRGVYCLHGSVGLFIDFM